MRARSGFASLDLALLLFPIVALLQVPLDPDLGWHLRVGQDLWTGLFPVQDRYTWSMPGYAWVDHEWLTDAIVYGMHHLLGLAGVSVFFGAFALAAFGLAARTGALIHRHMPDQGAGRWSAGASWRLAAILAIVGLLVSQSVVSARAQMITVAGFALVNFLLWQYLLAERRSVWVLPVVFWMWANLHGGFVIGLAQVGLAAGALVAARLVPALRTAFPFSAIPPGGDAARIRHLIFVALASCAATLINPYTVGLYEEAARTGLDGYARTVIREWLPVSLNNGAIILMFAFVFLFGLLWLRRYYSAWHLLLAPIFLYLGLSSIRHSPLLVIFMLPWVYLVLASQPALAAFFNTVIGRLFGFRRGRWGYQAYNAVLVLIPLAILGLRLVQYASVISDPAEIARRGLWPQQAVAFLKTQLRPGDVLFNHYNWGGYLIWNLPEEKIYIDGRMASWRTPDRHILAEYVRITELAPDWLDRLDANQVTLILIPQGSPLASALRQQSAFRAMYEDDLAILFRRTSPAASRSGPIGRKCC